MHGRHPIFAILLTLTGLPCRAADQPPDCSTFTWDMGHELTLFAGTAPMPLGRAVC